MTLKKAHILFLIQAAHDNIYNQCSQFDRIITEIVFVSISLLFVVFSVGVVSILFFISFLKSKVSAYDLKLQNFCK
jgi:hypothetical protein